MANEHSQIVPSMQPTSTVADFKFWCQKVLPLVYDDSLSYYEVLNKMVIYLNQVIDNINADTANVAELEDDFLLLQTYVNNFFDDIDQLVTYTERAEAAQTAAATSAINAATSASNAATSASNSAGSASSAATSALSAMDAKDAAVAAKTAAEAALANAQTAATNAANSATAASNSATAASGSATNAAASAASALQNFQLSDAARVAAQSAADDAEAAAELIDMDATASDVGKAIIVKTVGGGKVTAYEFGESGGGGGTGGIVNSIENVPVASFDDGTDAPVVELVVGIEPVQSGSGDPSPDNVRPITGWTGANVIRAGKNLIPNDVYAASATRVRIGASDDNANIMLKQGIYSLYIGYPSNISVYLGYYGEAINDYQRIGITNTKLNITISEPTEIIGLYVYSPDGVNPNSIESYLQVGNVTPEQIPSEVTTYSLTFPTEAGTVYGGTLTNLGADEWKLTIDRRLIVFNNETASFRAGTDGNPNSARINLSSDDYGSYPDRLKMLSNQYKTISTTSSVDNAMRLSGSSSTPQSELITIYDSRFTDAETMATLLAANPVQIVYPLYTKREYSFTEAEIINLLAGYNNVWADTGNINLLKYIANGKQYVDEKDSLVKALIAKELDSMNADTALVANDFRIVNNTLYKITGNIASGGTLTPGTNCVATTVGEILKTLLT